MNINSAFEFSTYARLERLFNLGARFAIVESQSISKVALNASRSGAYYESSYNKGVDHFLVELPDGFVFITGDERLFLWPHTTRGFFLIRKSDDSYRVMVDRRILSLQTLTNDKDSPAVQQELEFLNRIKGNLKPLELRSVDVGWLKNIAYALGAVFVVLFAFSAVRLVLSGTILVFPRISRTYRILAKYGDPARLIRECKASFGESRTLLRPREHLLVDRFVIYASSTSVLIAPVTELVRAHVTRVFVDTDERGLAMYEMELFFTKGVRISYRVSNKAEGIGELNFMKRYNKNMNIGFNLEHSKYEMS